MSSFICVLCHFFKNLRHFSDVKGKREQLHFQIKGDDCRTITATLSRTGKRWAVTYHIQRALKCWSGAVPSFEWIFFSNADKHTIEAVIALITPGGSLFRQFHQICHQNPERGFQSFSRLNKYQPPSPHHQRQFPRCCPFSGFDDTNNSKTLAGWISPRSKWWRCIKTLAEYIQHAPFTEPC